ncbi:hypothetical protein DH2020_005587 [Rehmannia glutinosa]|uniref:Uncharacterized protein n=1 Tax=Rehmannia glutinosa TaxID=99300 RepID=A0ABR0XH17_REHGL
MAATAVTQAPLSGLALSGGLGGGGGPPENGLMTYVNSLRISAVIDRLSLHVRGQLKSDADEFYNLCLSLARGIDFAIAHHEFPSRAQELPSLAKQVCQCKIDTLIQAAIMVLMISVKNACQCGWFPDKDSEELLNLAKEPGFDAYLRDFQISKKFKASPGNEIDGGPQMPTAVRYLLKYGSNLLQAVGEFNDGSWNAVMDSDTAIQKPEDKISDTGDGESPQPVDLLDLTQTNDGMDFVTTNETEDRKLSRSISRNQSMTQTISVEPHIANTDNVNQRSAHVEDDFWSGIFLSSLGQGPSNEQIGGVFVPTSNYIASPPVFTDSFTTNGQVEGFNGNNLFTASVPQREPSLPNTLQLQQFQFGNSNYTAEYGRFPSLPRNVTRTPTAVQALPAQTSTSILQERSRNTARRANLHQVSQMSSSPLHQYSGVQNPGQENRSFSTVQPPHQNVALQATNQVPDAQRVLNERQLSSQQMANLMMPRAMGQPPAMSQPSYSMNPNGRRMPSVVGDQWSNVGVASPPLMTTDAYDPAQQTWRPAGRMRGALSGQAYADAYNRFMSQHNQQAAQAARPISNVHLDNVNVPAESFMPPNYPSARPASLPGGSGVFF